MASDSSDWERLGNRFYRWVGGWWRAGLCASSPAVACLVPALARCVRGACGVWQMGMELVSRAVRIRMGFGAKDIVVRARKGGWDVSGTCTRGCSPTLPADWCTRATCLLGDRKLEQYSMDWVHKNRGKGVGLDTLIVAVGPFAGCVGEQRVHPGALRHHPTLPPLPPRGVAGLLAPAPFSARIACHG